MMFNSLNKYLKFIVAIIPLFLFSGCGFLFGMPVSSEKAIAQLTDALGYEPTFIEEKKVRSEEKSLHNDYYYEFEDEYGMRFAYVSKIAGVGLDGADFYYRYENFINYDYRLLPFYSDTIKALCDKYGFSYWKRSFTDYEYEPDYDIFGNETQFGSSMFCIECFDDLDAASRLVSDILDACRIHSSKEWTALKGMPSKSIVVAIGVGGEKRAKVGEYKLLYDEDVVDTKEIYTELKKNYIELVKKEKIKNDLPDNMLEEVCPDYLQGRYNGQLYDLWHIELVDDTDIDNPEYKFTMYYKEPPDREKYQYYPGYYNKDMTIQNFIAQLGGTCFFSEKEPAGDAAGFNAYLGDDIYFFGFVGDNNVLIRKNDTEYVFDTQIYNPANNSYQFQLTKEEMEEIFGISITYNKALSVFDVNR